MPIVVYSGCRSCKNVESGVLRPVAIFHKVVIVGMDCPLSICPNMGLLTPVILAASSKLISRPARTSRRRSPIKDVVSFIISLSCVITCFQHVIASFWRKIKNSVFRIAEDGGDRSPPPIPYAYIRSLLTTSIARSRMLFIRCTHSI